MMQQEDAPYLLKDQSERERRVEMLTLPHIKPLTDFLALVADSQGKEYEIPHLDPCDGGIHARALFLLEAPGPKAVESGFVSRDNPDPTARNLWHLMRDAQIPRLDTLIWNIVPWYVGDIGRIRPANSGDLGQALPHLKELLHLLPRLQLIVLVGRKAQSAGTRLHCTTSLTIMQTYHMSAQVFNVWPDKKRETQKAFAAVAKFLRDNKESNSCPNH